MRSVMTLIVLSSVGSLLSEGQSIPINESPPPARTYHLLREDDDWSFLADSRGTTRLLGSHQIHSSAIRPEWLVPIYGRRSSRDLGTDWKR